MGLKFLKKLKTKSANSKQIDKELNNIIILKLTIEAQINNFNILFFTAGVFLALFVLYFSNSIFIFSISFNKYSFVSFSSSVNIGACSSNSVLIVSTDTSFISLSIISSIILLSVSSEISFFIIGCVSLITSGLLTLVAEVFTFPLNTHDNYLIIPPEFLHVSLNDLVVLSSHTLH